MSRTTRPPLRLTRRGETVVTIGYALLFLIAMAIIGTMEFTA